VQFVYAVHNLLVSDISKPLFAKKTFAYRREQLRRLGKRLRVAVTPTTVTLRLPQRLDTL